MKKNLLSASAASFRAANNSLSPAAKALATFLITGLSLSAGQVQAQTAGFVQWPLEANNQDKASVRSTGLAGNAATFKRLTISDGQVPTGANAFAPYTAGLGQAFAVLANGGGWSSNATPPGPGSAPRRTFYEQFSATASAPTRLDSLILEASVASSASGKIAVVYSLSNFVSDSVSITGGKGPAISNSTITLPGGPLASTANGTFGAGVGTASNGATLPQYATGGVPSTFRFALTSGSGVTLAAGQTLTVRLYFGVGSSSAGRYVLLRNVTLKSQQLVTAAKLARAQQPLNVYPNPAQSQLVVAHPAAEKGAVVSIYSATGQKAASFSTQPGTTSTDLRIGTLSSGIYLVEYTDGAQRITSKIVKE